MENELLYIGMLVKMEEDEVSKAWEDLAVLEKYEEV